MKLLEKLANRRRVPALTYELTTLPSELPKGAKVEAEYRFDYEMPASRSGAGRVSLEVAIASSAGKGFYILKEPPVTPALKQKIELAIRSSYLSMPASELLTADPLGYLILAMKEAGPLKGATEEELLVASYYLHRDVLGYGLVDPFLKDPLIEDVSCDGMDKNIRIWHSTYNQFDWLESLLKFEAREALDATALRFANRSGAFVSAATPLVDATLPEGYRLSCTWRNEVSSFGSSFTVRKFRSKPFSITELLHFGALNYDVAAFLWCLLELKGFVFIVGPSASGKTTLLNSLASLMSPNWKVVTIEDVRELNLPHPGWKALHTRTGALSGYGRVDLFELVKLSLRERPDYVVLGEARGAETSVLFQSASTGHGCLATFHATDEDALCARLTQPPINVPFGLINLVDAVVFVTKTPGTHIRYVQRVSEYQDGWRTIFKRAGDGYEGGSELAIKLWRRGEANGLGGPRMASLLEGRRRFLEAQVKEQVFSCDELAKRLGEYYAPGGGVLNHGEKLSQ